MRTFILLAITLLAGCSTGRYYPHTDQGSAVYLSATETQSLSSTHNHCLRQSSPIKSNQQQTIFVHPGLLLFNAKWDRGLAVAGAQKLINDGYGTRLLEIKDRNPEQMLDALTTDKNTRFIGLHYSMGGSPKVLIDSIAVTKKAAIAINQPLSYFPILVDPTSFSGLNGLIDMDSPYLGQMFVVLSAEYAFLRPDIMTASKNILDHPKTHLLYAEDFGVKWQHFDALSTLTEPATTKQPTRAEELFTLIATGINTEISPQEMASLLAQLKIKYALADQRSIRTAWVQQAQSLACLTHKIS